jgi:glutamate-5-semialdehyde dehydrogenase
MARKISLNAKVQRPGVCNAVETLLVHRSQAQSLLPTLIDDLQKAGVEVRATPEIKKICKSVKVARPKDFGYEFLDLVLAVKLVGSLQEAIEHIQQYGTQHTDAIVTRNTQNAEAFLNKVHSSVVLANASTRFNDGGEMGMGAEIGISTTKLHAFGPMGLEELTIGHYRVHGDGQIRS